jgi:hypothetical protein
MLYAQASGKDSLRDIQNSLAAIGMSTSYIPTSALIFKNVLKNE